MSISPRISEGAFYPAQRKCLAKKNLVKDIHDGKVTYDAFFGEDIYAFGKDDAGWN